MTLIDTMNVERDINRSLFVNSIIFLVLNFNETNTNSGEYRVIMKKKLLTLLNDFDYTFLESIKLDKFNLLELAIDSRDQDIIYSIANLTDSDDINKYLETDLLQYCLQKYSFVGIRILLRFHRKAHYNPNLIDKGSNSFILACKYELDPLIDFYLRQYGPELDLSLRDSEGHTAEYYAYVNDNTLLYKCLNNHSGLPFQPVDTEYDTCGICREECHTTLKCGHYFHFECISQWVDECASCPMCRQYIL